MKTNQVMKRDDAWIQRTKDGYFNANKLLDSYNKMSGEKKMLGNYSKLQGTKEYIDLLITEGIKFPTITGRGQGENSGTWMHPKLFIDFAMWLSVEFKSKVVDYVLDGLIKTRTDAGDYYNEMCAAILINYMQVNNSKPTPFIYVNEAKMIRELAGVTDKQRNEMTESELNKLTILQKVNTTLINNHIGKESRRKQLNTIAVSI